MRGAESHLHGSTDMGRELVWLLLEKIYQGPNLCPRV